MKKLYSTNGWASGLALYGIQEEKRISEDIPSKELIGEFLCLKSETVSTACTKFFVQLNH